MADLRGTVAALATACRAAGVDPEQVFQHLSRDDIAEYGCWLESGSLPPDNLPTFMAAVVRAVEIGQCLCSKCIASRRTQREVAR